MKVCTQCKRYITEKNDIALNKKMLNRDIQEFMCIDCLAKYLNTTVAELYERIKIFKSQGCDLFN